MTVTRASIREATEADYDTIIDLVVEAFLRDPVYNYFGSLKEFIPKDRDTIEKQHRKTWATFLLKLTILGGGRVTVIVEHNIGDESTSTAAKESERIVGVAEWLPPNKRVKLWHVRTMLRAGIISMLGAWGLTGLLRCGFEWLDGTEGLLHKVFKKRGLGNPDATWYLFQIAILPECQGKGYMSQLFREAFEHAPDAVFTLDATTAGSRDKYAHVGFEEIGIVTLGKGKSNPDGFADQRESAVGVNAYTMIKLPK